MSKAAVILLYSIPLALGLGLMIAMAFPSWPSWVAGWLGGAIALPLTHFVRTSP